MQKVISQGGIVLLKLYSTRYPKVNIYYTYDKDHYMAGIAGDVAGYGGNIAIGIYPGYLDGIRNDFVYSVFNKELKKWSKSIRVTGGHPTIFDREKMDEVPELGFEENSENLVENIKKTIGYLYEVEQYKKFKVSPHKK